jgi:hypothetical protein
MEMPELQWGNTSVNIRISGNQTDVFAKAHLSLRETDAFMSPPYGGSGKRNMQNEGELLHDAHNKPSISSRGVTYIKEASLRLQFVVHCMRSSCNLLVYDLYKGYS